MKGNSRFWDAFVHRGNVEEIILNLKEMLEGDNKKILSVSVLESTGFSPEIKFLNSQLVKETVVLAENKEKEYYALFVLGGCFDIEKEKTEKSPYFLREGNKLTITFFFKETKNYISYVVLEK